jgi:hypothetical protein
MTKNIARNQIGLENGACIDRETTRALMCRYEEIGSAKNHPG